MEIFISWSGKVSCKVAGALRLWLKKVIRTTVPWMSDKDLEGGARWTDSLTANLSRSKLGIVCVTPDNLGAPWLHFEAGAIARTLQDEYVCPYLFALEPANISGPLSHFQACKADRDGTWRLLQTVNSHPALTERYSEADLLEVFEVWWPRLELTLRTIELPSSQKKEDRPVAEMVEEVLNVVRGLARRYSKEPRPDKSTRKYAFIHIDSRPLVGDDGPVTKLSYAGHSRVDQLLDEIYFIIQDHVEAYKYGDQWLLQDKESGRVFSAMGSAWVRPQGQRDDQRPLSDVGISPGMTLEVIPCPAAEAVPKVEG